MRPVAALLLVGSVLLPGCVFAEGGRLGVVGTVVQSTCPIRSENADGFIESTCNNPHVAVGQRRILQVKANTNLSAQLVRTTITPRMHGDTLVGNVLLAEYY